MKHLPSLNGLRAISIIIVWLGHIHLHYNLFDFSYFPILGNGHFGVNVFFVISGFLITSLLLYEEKTTGSISLKDFYYRRTLRIFPAYYFFLIVLCGLTLFNVIKIPPESWLTSVTYTKYFNWEQDWFTAHAWSLSVEEQFYLVWPLLFIQLKKYRTLIILAVLVAVPIIRIFHHETWLTSLTLAYRVDAIAMGCFVAIHKERILELLQRNWKLFFWVALGIIYIMPFTATPWYMEYPYLHIGFIIIGFFGAYGTIANIAIALVMLYVIYGPKGYWYKFLNHPVMNQIGLWSYSMYLWQQLFFYTSAHWFNQFPISVAIALAASIGSYYLIEKPFLKLRDIKKAAI